MLTTFCVNSFGFSIFGYSGVSRSAFFQSAVSLPISSATSFASKSPTITSVVLFGANTFWWKATQSAGFSASTVLTVPSDGRPRGCVP